METGAGAKGSAPWLGVGLGLGLGFAAMSVAEGSIERRRREREREVSFSCFSAFRLLVFILFIFFQN